MRIKFIFAVDIDTGVDRNAAHIAGNTVAALGNDSLFHTVFEFGNSSGKTFRYSSAVQHKVGSADQVGITVDQSIVFIHSDTGKSTDDECSADKLPFNLTECGRTFCKTAESRGNGSIGLYGCHLADRSGFTGTFNGGFGKLLRSHTALETGKETLPIPTGIAFKDLRAYKVIGDTVETGNNFSHSHKTGIKTDDRNIDGAVFEDFSDFPGQHSPAIAAVVIHTGSDTAAVVPHNERIIFAFRSLIAAPFQKSCQGIGGTGIQFSPGFPNDVDTVFGRVDQFPDPGIAPGTGSGCTVPKHINFNSGIQIGFLHLKEGFKSVLIQIVIRGHIDKDGPGIFVGLRETHTHIISTIAAIHRCIDCQGISSLSQTVERNFHSGSCPEGISISVSQDVFDSGPITAAVGKTDLAAGVAFSVKSDKEEILPGRAFSVFRNGQTGQGTGSTDRNRSFAFTVISGDLS